MDDKVEYNRYNESSAKRLETIKSYSFSTVNDLPEYLRQPYIFYVEQISNLIKPGMDVLELCCGDGIHTVDLARTGATIISTDIAENSIKLASVRLEREGFTNITFEVADAEDLGNFSENSFDIVTCVGSLSYVDLDKFTYGVKRVLKKGGGRFICLDSFNHNPVYRLNRYIHYLRGERSYGTLVKMPNMGTIRSIRKIYSNVDVKYFGIFAFLAPALLFFIPHKIAAQIINKLDQFFPSLRRYAFKIVISATK
jgi:ubiquinone/menaquinone biosynthesis C-methylase UbiE